MQKTSSLIRRIIFQARPFWPHISGIFILTVLATPLALMKPLALKLLIDSAFGSHPVPDFIRMFFPSDFKFTFNAIVILSASLVIIVALIDNLLSLASWILSTYTGEKLVLDFRIRLFNHIQRLSLAYHDTTGTSDALYKIQWDTMGIRTFLLNNLLPLISSFITLFAMIAVILTINLQFALIALCIIPPLFILIRFFTARLKKDWEKVKDDESLAMSVLHEVLSSLRIVKAFGQENGEEDRFINKSGKAVKGQLKIAWLAALFNFWVGIMFAAGTASFIYLGATYVYAGVMTLGELTLMLAYLVQFFVPLQIISKNITDIQSSVASVERVFSLLDKEHEVVENSSAVHLQQTKGSFKFQNVHFGYNKEQDILQNISFEVKPGDRVGMMGSTGAGKSSLMSLLMRFYDPTSGKILLDGQDIKDIKLADYRNQFGIVLQEPVLFSTTIAENIRYGRPGANETDIVEAAKAANAHEFIMKCKDGYDSLVGERGMQLSGGERQRISIARAFIKNAPVLILDEPTSSLDVRTEAQIMQAIERLMEGRTTFMITHRLDTLKSCNLILHLEKGQLVDIVRDFDDCLIEQKKNTILNNQNQLTVEI